MRFIGRKSELSKLDAEYNRDSSFVVIYGRRRVGKTTLIKACGLPVERYFNPEIMREESELRQRVSHKLKLCPEEYLPIIEGAIDSAILIEKPKKNETEDV